MKRYTYEVKAFITVRANSEEDAYRKLDMLLPERHDTPQLVNVTETWWPARFLDLSDTGIDNRARGLDEYPSPSPNWRRDHERD